MHGVRIVSKSGLMPADVRTEIRHTFRQIATWSLSDDVNVTQLLPQQQQAHVEGCTLAYAAETESNMSICTESIEIVTGSKKDHAAETRELYYSIFS